ncbi:MAG: carboxylesterase [Spirochaeta sp.]|nr:carboxylesterase [Spirochaeta sp.]RPG08736.1 MAG: carboxylesterase [Proteobacteria bacterium TMED72]
MAQAKRGSDSWKDSFSGWHGSLSVIGLLVCLIVFGCGRPEAVPTLLPDTLRQTEQGATIGFRSENGAHVWRGIPFARPPVGALRWRAPQEPESWDGVREALEFGFPCPQFDVESPGSTVGSEDCLTLNVYAPPWAPAEVPHGEARVPVMVWIHGGGNSYGDTRFYEGSLLALRGPVVVVTIQYRLGVFGWFSHPALREGVDPADDSGNYGTLDVIRALSWVQANISSFGGDPDRVLVFGESAGGSDTHAMLLSPLAEGLFSRAISQSGSARMTLPSYAENDVDDVVSPGASFSSGELLLWLLVEDGQATDRASAKTLRDGMSSSEVGEYLRGTSPETFLAFFAQFGNGPMYSTPQLLRDGYVLPETTAVDAYAQGRFNRVPAIFGTNRDETKLFMMMGSEHVRRLAGIPLWRSNASLYDASAMYTSQNWKRVGVDDPAQAVRAHQEEIWAYRFDWDEERRLLGYDLPGLVGAGHAMEIPFVFGGLSLGPASGLVFDPARAETDEALSDAMMSYWTEFAYSGDPGRGREGQGTDWPAWSAEPEGPKMMVLDSANDGGIRPSSEVVTKKSIRADSLADTRLRERRDWCAVMALVTGNGRAFDPQEYEAYTDGLCEGFPLDTDGGGV